MKKNILIAAPPMDTGGVTSSLISLLNCIDYEMYNVDLILMRNSGEYLNRIPEEVNLLAPALEEKNYFTAKLKKLFYYTIYGYLPYRLIYGLSRGRKYRCGDFQLMSGLARCRTARKPEKEYDTVIGYMEGFENVYAANCVKAKRRLGYIHVDYIKAGLDPKLDEKILSKLDNIVLVSEENKKTFDKVFPQFSNKSAVVENIVSERYINELAVEKVTDFELDEDCLNIVTAARLVNAHKGLDRAVSAAVRLKNDGYNIRWYVFGDGPDRAVLEKMIEENKISDIFFLMGNRKNVYPYIKKADVMVMPSRYEGKPVAVSEAQVLGIVPIVTEYASAHEQISSGIDGLILENNDESVYYGIKRILDEGNLLESLRAGLLHRKTDFSKGLEQIYDLIDTEKQYQTV